MKKFLLLLFFNLTLFSAEIPKELEPKYIEALNSRDLKAVQEVLLECGNLTDYCDCSHIDKVYLLNTIVRIEYLLHLACVYGNLKVVKDLVENNISPVDGITDHISTPIARACDAGHLYIMKYLISKGANARLTPYSTSLLTISSGRGYFDIVEYLFTEELIDLEDEQSRPYNALQNAARCNHIEIVKLLLSKGFKVDSRGFYSTALYTACQEGRLEIVKLLIDNGANIELKKTWLTKISSGVILKAACVKGHLDIVKLLINKGADINAIDDEQKAGLFYYPKNKEKDLLEIFDIIEENCKHKHHLNKEYFDKSHYMYFLRMGIDIGVNDIDFSKYNVETRYIVGKDIEIFEYIKNNIEKTIMSSNLDEISQLKDLHYFISTKNISHLLFHLYESKIYKKNVFTELLKIIHRDYNLTRIVDEFGRNLLFHALNKNDIKLATYLFLLCQNLLTKDCYILNATEFIAMAKEIIKSLKK